MPIHQSVGRDSAFGNDGAVPAWVWPPVFGRRGKRTCYRGPPLRCKEPSPFQRICWVASSLGCGRAARMQIRMRSRPPAAFLLSVSPLERSAPPPHHAAYALLCPACFRRPASAMRPGRSLRVHLSGPPHALLAHVSSHLSAKARATCAMSGAPPVVGHCATGAPPGNSQASIAVVNQH